MGYILTANEKPADGFTVDPSSIAWNGGTDVSNYVSQGYNDPAPNTGGPTTGVLKNQTSYKFVLDATAKTYTITLDLRYTGQPLAPAEVTFTFESIRPTVATLTTAAKLGAPTAFPDDPTQPGSFVGVALSNPKGKAPGMAMNANTTTGDFGGSFAIVQLAQIQRSKVVGGQPFHERNIGGGWNIDNSYPTQSGVFGYPTIGTGANFATTTSNGWIVKANQSQDKPHSLVDVPFVPAATGALTSIDIGNLGKPNLPQTEEFESYLMYRPNGGVWVALVELDWRWAIHADVNGVKITQGQTDFDHDSTTTPLTNKWPTWTGTTSMVLKKRWIAGP